MFLNYSMFIQAVEQDSRYFLPEETKYFRQYLCLEKKSNYLYCLTPSRYEILPLDKYNPLITIKTEYIHESDIPSLSQNISCTKAYAPIKAMKISGVWFHVFEGVEILIVEYHSNIRIPYFIISQSSHYFRTMTRSAYMPVLKNERY